MKKTFIAALLLVPVSFAAAADETKVADETKSDEAVVTAVQGAAKIDGEIDDAWKQAPKVAVEKRGDESSQGDLSTATVQLLWDKDHVFALWRVKDSELSASNADNWAQDSIELFIDQNYARSGSYDDDDGQYRVNFEGELSGQGSGFDVNDLRAATKKTENGYVVEMAVKIKHAELKPGAKLGIEFQVNNDAGEGFRDTITKWNDIENDSWENTTDFGTLLLK